MDRPLSPRELELVDMAVQGLTTEAMAVKLGISVGTVNTYWLRIRSKVGALSRPSIVAKVVKEHAEELLNECYIDRDSLLDRIAKAELALLELRSSNAVLQLAVDNIRAAIWSADQRLVIKTVRNPTMPDQRFGMTCETGKTVYDIFRSQDPQHPAIAAHLNALRGETCTVELSGEFQGVTLKTLPLLHDAGTAIGCVGIIRSSEM